MSHINIIQNNTKSNILYQDNNCRSLFSILKDNGYYLYSPCGGNGYCNKCMVIVDNHMVKACTFIPCGDITVHIPSNSDITAPELVNTNKQNNTIQSFSVAMDIGSTSISIALVNCANTDDTFNSIIDTKTFNNPSCIYGADIISRAQASSAGLKDTIAKLLTDSLETETLKIITKNKLNLDFLHSIYIACNTTMQHLLLSLDCTGLLSYPFNYYDFTHSFIYKGYSVYIIPSLCTFVGGDIVSGLYYLNPVFHKNYLFLDIGTNAEIVLTTASGTYCTSAAAGPAFEGANISCGTAYINGAINNVSITSAHKVTYKTIGNKLPCGLCGTGILDTYANMIRQGIIDEFKTFTNASYIDNGFEIARSVNGPIIITQNDIRQIQVAISAIRTAISILLTTAKLTISDLEKIYISGSFGSSLSLETLNSINIISDILLNHDIISFVGNSSLLGAVKAALNNYKSEDFSNIVNSYTEIELANHPDFNTLFLKYM